MLLLSMTRSFTEFIILRLCFVILSLSKDGMAHR